MIVVFILISFIPIIYNKNYTITSSKTPYNNTLCVTYDNLRYYNYSELLEYYDPSFVIPENYCYGILSYNITKDDFNNILALNLEAYKKYRSYLNLFYMYNNSATIISMDPSCLSYFRSISCLSTFSACQENTNGTVQKNGICQSDCDLYNIRCGDYAVYEGFCDNNSTEAYCAGVNSAIYLKINVVYIFIILFILAF